MMLVRGASELLTCAAGAADGIGRIPGGQVLIEDGQITAAGELGDVSAEIIVDAAGKVVMPGFVDCHTHAVFGGDRVDEYVCGCAGARVPVGAPIGIAGTAAATRLLGPEQLAEAAAPRLLSMRAHGTTTVEIKSGYGLTPESELAMLQAARMLARMTGIDVVATFMGAHALPPERDRADYVDEVIATIPRVAAAGLAEFCDAYCEDGYFTTSETQRILAAGLAHGLAPKIHLDAYGHTGAAMLAVRMNATSADHLNYTLPAEVECLADAGVVGVVMPLLDFAVQHKRPARPRELLDRGLRIALATDCCPGCSATSMQLVIQHACRTGGLSVAQAIRASTIDAAAALGRDAIAGSLEEGKRADLLILDTERHEQLGYRLGHNAVRTVIVNGEMVCR